MRNCHVPSAYGKFYMMRNEFEKLNLLISQGQFELLLPQSASDFPCNIRLVYLMNDAVESFLVFHEAELTGIYDPDYQGELRSTLKRSEEKNVLIIYQLSLIHI